MKKGGHREVDRPSLFSRLCYAAAFIASGVVAEQPIGVAPHMAGDVEKRDGDLERDGLVHHGPDLQSCETTVEGTVIALCDHDDRRRRDVR